MNSRRLLTAGCFLTACSMSFTFAGENDKGEKKETQSEPKTGAAVIEVRETGESAEKPITAQAKRIVIAINGDTKEFELNNSPDESKKEAKKIIIAADEKSKGQPAIIGHGMIVGPNGEKKTFKFGSPKENKDVLQDLPEEVRKRLEKVMKDATKREVFGQILMIGPDGVAKSVEINGENPKSIEILNLQDGDQRLVERVIERSTVIDGSTIEGIHELIKGTIQGARKTKVPDGVTNQIEAFFDIEVAEDNLKDAIKKMRAERPESSAPSQSKNQKGKKKPNGNATGDAVSDKLDLILKRLDQIEKRVRNLENN